MHAFIRCVSHRNGCRNVKRHRLRRAISHWVALHDYDGPGRIDIICVAKDRVEKHLRGYWDFF